MFYTCDGGMDSILEVVVVFGPCELSVQRVFRFVALGCRLYVAGYPRHRCGNGHFQGCGSFYLRSYHLETGRAFHLWAQRPLTMLLWIYIFQNS